jgi:hypothetical protein
LSIALLPHTISGLSWSFTLLVASLVSVKGRSITAGGPFSKLFDFFFGRIIKLVEVRRHTRRP